MTYHNTRQDVLLIIIPHNTSALGIKGNQVLEFQDFVLLVVTQPQRLFLELEHAVTTRINVAIQFRHIVLGCHETRLELVATRRQCREFLLRRLHGSGCLLRGRFRVLNHAIELGLHGSSLVEHVLLLFLKELFSGGSRR